MGRRVRRVGRRVSERVRGGEKEGLSVFKGDLEGVL